MHCHPSFDNTLSGAQTGFPLKKQPQIGGAVLTVRRIGRRNRAGAGAGDIGAGGVACRRRACPTRRDAPRRRSVRMFQNPERSLDRRIAPA